MTETVLAGCSPTPLASYLKALGVLRLLSKSFPGTRAGWRGESLVLSEAPSSDALEKFFLHTYSPTPVLAPWNAGSGFYYQERKSKDKDPITGKRIKLGVRDQPTEATKTIDLVADSRNERFGEYRRAIQLCRDELKRLGLAEAPKAEQKDRLLLLLRNTLPENCLEWIDAALLITSEGAKFPPLLGTGGNDGNLDFTSNFMQRLVDVIGVDDGTLPAQSSDWLRTSLFAQTAPGLIAGNIGQFSPGRAGGPNATTGFESDSSINPWDFVLMIEGALPFAAAAVRRSADDPDGVLSYPFTVRAVGAGSGSLGEGDAVSARGELWMPLWGQAATYPEVRALLAEGRVALGRKPARDALDFVRAVHRLGSYRGVDSFQRYGLLMRSGKAYLATPLARVEVARNSPAPWLDDLDQQGWLTRFRRFAQGENVARRFLTLRRRLEDATFDFAGRAPSAAEAQELTILLGDIEAALASSKKARESVSPVPRLSARWVQMADDGTPAFRIARALAGMNSTDVMPLPLLAQLFPVHPTDNVWMTPEYRGKHSAKDLACRVRIHTSTSGSLIETLISLLSARLRLAEQLDIGDKPLLSSAGITVDDLLVFLRSDHMDRRIAALLPGLCLCSIPRDMEHTVGGGVMPAAFALLKLCLTPNASLRKLHLIGEEDSLPVPVGLLAQLAAGNIGNRAVLSAWRRLSASGVSLAVARDALPELGEIDPRRAAAGLLIPLRFSATGAMARSVLASQASETKTAGENLPAGAVQ
jgi:CRISPR-associated protein Csx17